MIKYFDINNPGCSIKCKIYCDNVRDINNLVIYGHGFGGHKDNKACERFAEKLLSKYKHCAVLVYDFPCHGSDVRKKLSLEDCNDYITQVVEYTKKEFNSPKLYAYGTSFGGYLFLKYIAENDNPFERLALRCPAINMYEVFKNRLLSEENLEKLEKGKEIQAGFDRKINVDKSFFESVKNADIREYDYLEYADDILLIHGTKDEIVPFEQTLDFSEKNVIELIASEGADHRFQDRNKMDVANQQIIEFFKM